jgi:hypothetical protein
VCQQHCDGRAACEQRNDVNQEHRDEHTQRRERDQDQIMQRDAAGYVHHAQTAIHRLLVKMTPMRLHHRFAAREPAQQCDGRVRNVIERE